MNLKIKVGEAVSRNNRIFAIIFIITLSLTSSVFAGQHKDKKLWWRNSHIVEELQLTPGQVEKIESIFQAYKDKIKSFNKELNTKEKMLKNLIQNTNSTRDEVLLVTDDINTLKADGEKLKVNMYWEIREVLTPKQRTQLQLIKERYMQGNPKNMIYFLDECLAKENTFY